VPTLLYGLTLAADPRDASASASADAGGVRTLSCGALTAIVATIAGPPTPSLEAVREHDLVLQRFVDRGATVAAVRFGQLFGDDAACCHEVRALAGRVERLLEEYHDCVEMRVLLRSSDAPPAAQAAPPPDDMGPGRAYLESLRTRGEVAPRVSLAPILGPVVRAERVEFLAAAGGCARGVAFAHLVHRADLAAYRQSLQEVPSLSEARVVGPLPLYAFAEPRQ
jgi:hypothetical protein